MRGQPVDPGEPLPDGIDATHVAACALLLEIAWADGEFSASERTHPEGVRAHHFGLGAEEGSRLLAVADEERRRSVDHFRFTSTLLRDYDIGQKMVLAKVMWGLVLADGQIAEHEHYPRRKISNLLELRPAYLATAKAAAESARQAGPYALMSATVSEPRIVSLLPSATEIICALGLEDRQGRCRVNEAACRRSLKSWPRRAWARGVVRARRGGRASRRVDSGSSRVQGHAPRVRRAAARAGPLADPRAALLRGARSPDAAPSACLRLSGWDGRTGAEPGRNGVAAFALHRAS
ncbi:MAG TPA: TerB family tellurite resistance protein [Longimicrobiales bacterium]|nr:TerB family tellurite resistance protein [Longimicrobiales bacterium]